MQSLKSHLVFLYLLVCCYTGMAQQIDALVNKLKQKDLPDTVRINTNNLISRNLSFINPLESMTYAEKALEQSLQIKYKRGIAESYRNLSSVYSYFGSFYLTVTNIQKAIDGYKELNDSVGLANCYISLGHAYRYLRNTQKEIEFHKLAFEIHSRQGDPERIGVTAHNLGESYFNNQEYQKAKEFTIAAIRINDSIRNIQVLSSCYKVMGKILLKENNLAEAEMYFQRILTIHNSLKEQSQKVATIEALIQLAGIAQKLNNKIKQEYYLQQAAEFVKTYNLWSYTRQVYLDLIEFYSRTNQRQKAFEYITSFKILSDSLSKIETKDKNQLVAGFTKMNELEKKNSALEVENKLRGEREKRKNYIIAYITGFSFVTLVLIILLFLNWRKIRNANILLEQQNLIIEYQKEKLEELNRTKDKFFAIVSHDLRAPLNALSMFTNFLRTRKLFELPKEKVDELLIESTTLVDNTKKLTDNLISWAKIQMKKEQARPKSFFVDQSVKEIVATHNEQAFQKKIQLQTYIPANLMVFADPDQFQFIIRNLINNAIKFTESGGTVTVSAKSPEPDIVEISVSDTGVGIPPELLKTIFKVGKMKRMEGTAGEVGSGLGLILVQEFVTLNKGEIRVTSELSKGTTFTVSLAAAKN